MTQYSYAQLERLWIGAGGSQSMAPLMAAIAMAESAGNSRAYNASGASGLWQIMIPLHSSLFANPSDVWNPQANAKAAVAIYKSQGLGAWETWTNGAYKQYFHGHIPPSANVAGGGAGGGGGGGTNTRTLVQHSTNLLGQTGALLHGTAVVLDRIFAMFAPGQGWRLVFGAGAAAAAFGSYKAFTAGAGDEQGELPLAIALLGIAALAAFMAMRAWPQAGGQAIKPGAYVVDVLKGEPPPAGPPAFSATEVQLTEIGIGALVGLWAAGKVAQGVGNLANAAGGIAGLLGGIWGWVKGIGGKLGGAAGDAASAAGEAVP